MLLVHNRAATLITAEGPTFRPDMHLNKPLTSSQSVNRLQVCVISESGGGAGGRVGGEGPAQMLPLASAVQYLFNEKSIPPLITIVCLLLTNTSCEMPSYYTSSLI